MKRLICIFLAVLMVTSISTAVFANDGSTGVENTAAFANDSVTGAESTAAAESTTAAKSTTAAESTTAAQDSKTADKSEGKTTGETPGKSVTYDSNGMTLNYTEDFENAKGVFYPYHYGQVADGVGYVTFLYFAMPQDEFDALMAKSEAEWTEDDTQTINEKHGCLLNVVSIDGGRGVSELIELVGSNEIPKENITLIGKAEDVTFYVFQTPEGKETYLKSIGQEYADDFNALCDSLLEVLKNGEFFVPSAPGSNLIGQTLRFETKDVDGTPVRSDELFKENDITMINIWATWCGPCKGELKELGEMHRRLAEKKVAVVGICTDADTETETCRSLLKENDVDYLNLLPFDNMNDSLVIPGYPTSYFVDSKGRILAAPVVGAPADMSTYEEVIEKLLKGDEPEIRENAPVQANDRKVYRVIVSNDEGAMVKGATVQFCSDTACMMAKTDKDGTAVFEAEEGLYTVHILKVPEGYERNTEEFTTLETYSDVYIVLQKTKKSEQP